MKTVSGSGAAPNPPNLTSVNWHETLVAAQEVIALRAGLLLAGDSRAGAELQRAVSEKVDFWCRWSWALSAGGWLEIHRSLPRMAGDAREKILENRERLTAA